MVTKQDKEALLQTHCEVRGQRMMAAFDAMTALSSDEREAVLAAVSGDTTVPITDDMRAYRVRLAAAYGVQP